MKSAPLHSPPLGARMPDSVHAVSCSLPTMAAVIGYEEKRPEILDRLQSGYPRFVSHRFVQNALQHALERLAPGDGRTGLLLGSEAAAIAAVAFAGGGQILPCDDFYLCVINDQPEEREALKRFVQHSGAGVYSRQAEAYLLRHGLNESPAQEELAPASDAPEIVRLAVAEAFGCKAEAIHLARSGMNAFYAWFQAARRLQRERGRDEWIQLGWLYLDTMEVLTHFHDGPTTMLDSVLDLDALAAILKERGDRVAGVVTEAPTNPLVQSADLERLQELCREHGALLAVDPSVTSPQNVPALKFADAAPLSLTKYAASKGDVILGALALNPASDAYAEISQAVQEHLTPPYLSDLRRLAAQIGAWSSVVQQINANTMRLAKYLEAHPLVRALHWAYSPQSAANYAALAGDAAPGAMLCLEIADDAATFYDSLDCCKGPSFGVEFTLACPFLYLAHFDLVRSPAGRQRLQRAGLDPESIRVSVGLEDPALLIDVFERALQMSRS